MGAVFNICSRLPRGPTWVPLLAVIHLRYSLDRTMKTLDRQPIPFTVNVFREASVYVAYAAELDVSSCGNTADQARENIKIAVRAFLQTAEEFGTLETILKEPAQKFRPQP